MVETAVLSPSSSAWAKFLDSNDHDIYHLPGYVALEAQRLGGEPLALLVEDGDRSLLLPLVLRPLPSGVEGKDAVSPNGYPGPLLSPGAHQDISFVSAAGVEMQEVLRGMKCCAAFVRCHPLLPSSEALFQHAGQFCSIGPTAWIDLGMALDERWADMNPKRRGVIRRTQRRGMQVRVDEEWASLESFVKLYSATMDRVEASDTYHLDLSYFEALHRELGERLHLLVVEQDRKVVGAGLFTEVCGIVQYHLSGTEMIRGLSPSAAMVEYASVWAQQRGNRVLHLGGGVAGAVDDLFRFKAGFSKMRGEYSSWRVIIDQDLFDNACEVLQFEDADNTSFFPPYRRI